MVKKINDVIIPILQFYTGEINRLDPSISKELNEETTDYLKEFCRIYNHGKRLDRKGVKGIVGKKAEKAIKLLENDLEKAYEYIFYHFETLQTSMSRNSYYRFRKILLSSELFNIREYTIWRNKKELSKKARQELLKRIEGELEGQEEK